MVDGPIARSALAVQFPVAENVQFTVARNTRSRSLAAAQDLLATTRMDQDARLFPAFEAVLEVLPVSRRFTNVALQSEAAASSNDFEALYDLARLGYPKKVDEPEQLKLWRGRGTRQCGTIKLATTFWQPS